MAVAARGFRGLTSLISDVDQAIASARSARATRPVTDKRPEESPKAEVAEPPYSFKPNAQGGQSASNLKWYLWIGGIVLVVALFSQNSRTRKPQYTPSTSEPQSSETAMPASAAPEDQPTEPEVQATEIAPPVGTNDVLSAPQIRYCLSEGIRLDAARSVVDATVDSTVDQFNLLVEDFNRRCSNYRYPTLVYSRVQAEVQANRGVLEAEGVARFPAPAAAPAIEPSSTYEAVPSYESTPSDEATPSDATIPSNEITPSDVNPPSEEVSPSYDSLSGEESPPTEEPLPAPEGLDE